MNKQSQQNKPIKDRLMHYGMMACCVVMLVPIVGFLLAGGTMSGLWSNAAVFAPLLLCVGAHLLMFKFMGKSCHSKEARSEIEEVSQTVPSTIPVVVRDGQ